MDWYPAFADELTKIAAGNIAQAVQAFCKDHKLDPTKAVLMGGAAMHVHGMRQDINDIDMFHPDLRSFTKGHYGGFEVDAGPVDHLPPKSRDSVMVSGLRVQSLPALLDFYQHAPRMNRPKDQPHIAALHARLHK
jgi:hypothetical protein